jgi:hypothetical protein
MATALTIEHKAKRLDQGRELSEAQPLRVILGLQEQFTPPCHFSILWY